MTICTGPITHDGVTTPCAARGWRSVEEFTPHANR